MHIAPACIFTNHVDRRDNHENDFDNLVIPTAEGLIRLRELHNYTTEEESPLDCHSPANHDTCHHISVVPFKEFQNEIAKFPQESLHSFRFSSSFDHTDVLKKKKRLYGTLPGHHIMKPLHHNKTNTVGGTSLNTIHARRKSLQIIPELPLKLSESSSEVTSSRTLSYTSTNSSDSTLLSPEEEEEDCYVPHLHNRLKQQNQAILTTYDDWRIILTNSIAQDVLVSHLHHKMNEEQHMLLVGKSVMDLIEPSYQNRLRSLIVKRRKELVEEGSENNAGMVLVCGNVVRCIYK